MAGLMPAGSGLNLRGFGFAIPAHYSSSLLSDPELRSEEHEPGSFIDIKSALPYQINAVFLARGLVDKQSTTT
jgi:hypothetical protein